MRIIKNVIGLILVIMLTGACAESSDTKVLLINKWVIDREAMRPILKAKPETDHKSAMAGAAFKEANVSEMLDDMLRFKIEFKQDGTFIASHTNSNITGKWSLRKNEKELIFKPKDKIRNKGYGSSGF